jgi:predicted nucleic acid-binding Zn ribbon protein
MSNKDDLIGYRRGSLVATAFSRGGLYAGQPASFWQCLCERCGRTVEFPRVRITSAKKSHGCCDICYRGGCWVCGSPVIGGKTIRRLCSDECKTQWIAKRKREAILAQKQSSPDFYAERYQRMKSNHATNETARESYNESQRRSALKYYYAVRRHKK